MTPVNTAIVHINVSLSRKIDESTFIDCITGECTDEKWNGHVLGFFLETPVWLIHDIVISGAFTFEELMNAQSKRKTKDYADDHTTRWIQEMAYLSMGKAADLGIARFI